MRNVGIEVYLPPRQIEAIDDEYENRSEYFRQLVEEDTGVPADGE